MSHRPKIFKLPIRSWMQKSSTKSVMSALQRQGHLARYVGGCVRDTLAGRDAIDNIDIATPAAPQTVIALLEGAGIRTIPTGLKHGTVTAVMNGEMFEITTLRRDITTDGRHATVDFTNDWHADATRRDFTINCIYCDEDGTLFDPLNGIEDLKAGNIRFVGNANKRIREDFLRILRFFRFFSDFGSNTPNREAIDACTELSSNLSSLSGERIRQELIKWLGTESPVASLRHATNCGVIANTLNFVPISSTFSEMENLVSIENKNGIPDPVRRLALFTLHSTETEKILRRLRFPRKVQRRLSDLLTLRTEIVPEAGQPLIRQTIYSQGTERTLDIALINWAQTNDQNDVDWQNFLQFIMQWKPPEFPVVGQDIIKLGIPEGEQLGQILEELEKWWVQENFAHKRSTLLTKALNIIADKTL